MKDLVPQTGDIDGLGSAIDTQATMSATEETVVKQDEAQEKETKETQEAPETQKGEKRQSTPGTGEDHTDEDSTDDEQEPASRDGSDKDDTVCMPSALPRPTRLFQCGRERHVRLPTPC